MNQKREPNYRALFYLALFFFALAIVARNVAHVKNVAIFVFLAIGGLFLFISLKNRDKWPNK